MINRRTLVLGTGFFFAAGCSTSGGGGSRDRSKFRLDKWRIQLPVNDSGNLSGSMKVVNPAKTVKPWFIASDDKLEFTCPVKGATSPNSSSPRTELAENNDWRIEQGGVMEGTVIVQAIPVGGRMTIAQVWGPDQPMRMSVTHDGSIQTAGKYSAHYTVGKVAIGEKFSFKVEVKDMLLAVSINGIPVHVYGVDQWQGKDEIYFKAGAYCSSSADTPPDALFKTTFTDLTISH